MNPLAYASYTFSFFILSHNHLTKTFPSFITVIIEPSPFWGSIFMHGAAHHTVGPVSDLDESEILHQPVCLTTVGQAVLKSVTSE